MNKFHPYLLSAILAVAILFIIRWGFICPGYEYEPDCFFHARIVEDGPSVFCAKTFPKLACSTWSEHYSDKELGFHFLLWGVTRIGKLFGATNDYPFHYQVMFFDTLLLIAFSILLYRHKVRHPWLYTLLVVTALPNMTYRMISLRAYLLSMTISVAVLATLLEERFYTWRWRFFAMAAFGFIATWSYSSPHLILCIIVPFAITDSIASRRWSHLFIMPACYVAGIVLGLTIHPQFPNTYPMFKVQCIDVILGFLLKVEKLPITGGDELYLSTFTLIKHHCWHYLLVIFAPLAIIIWHRRSFFAPGWLQNRCINGMVLTYIILIGLSLKIFRFNEYSIVPLCATLALLVTKYTPQTTTATFNKKEIMVIICALLCLVKLFHYTLHLPIQGNAELPCIGVAEWAKNMNIPKGTTIANFSWGKFPNLYFAMPEYTFCWGLDPAFAWRHTPDILRLVSDMEHKVPRRPEDFRKAFKSKYLYVYLLDTLMADYCWENGFIPIYSNWDGWIFDLEAPPRVITPQTPPLPLLNLVKEGKSAPFVLQMCIEGIGIMQKQNAK